VVEALTGIIAVVLFLVFGLTIQMFTFFVLLCLLLVVTFSDLDRMVIPDSVTIPGIVLGLALNALMAPAGVWKYLLGAFVGGTALLGVAILGELMFKKESMGGGDIKLAAMVGAFVGLGGVLLSLFLAVLVGAVVGGVLVVTRLRGRWQHLPFGPFIAAGTLLTVFWGDELIRAYKGLVLL
jgi:leader peptidase (prepilin peptidase)/N-methyltransferase